MSALIFQAKHQRTTNCSISDFCIWTGFFYSRLQVSRTADLATYGRDTSASRSLLSCCFILHNPIQSLGRNWWQDFHALKLIARGLLDVFLGVAQLHFLINWEMFIVLGSSWMIQNDSTSQVGEVLRLYRWVCQIEESWLSIWWTRESTVSSLMVVFTASIPSK